MIVLQILNAVSDAGSLLYNKYYFPLTKRVEISIVSELFQPLFTKLFIFIIAFKCVTSYFCYIFSM